MALGGYLPQINLGVQGVTQRDHHSGAQRVNPEFRVGSNFRIIPKQYFSGVENVVEFLENMDNILTYYEIPTQFACAYLKGHLTGRRLEPQIVDYVEVRNPQTTSNLLQIIDKYEERFLNRKIRGSSWESRDIQANENNRFPNRNRQENWRDTKGEPKLTLDFNQKSLIIPDDQIKQSSKLEKPVEIDLSDTKLGEGQKQKLRNLFNGFKGLFSDQPGLTHVLYHEMDTGDKGPVVSRPYRYDRVKQGIIDYHTEKMLQEGTICPIQSPYASPVVLTRKNNGLPPDSSEAYRLAIDYRKLNAINKYPRYSLPVIDDLITNIPHTRVMSTLDLKSGYFQLTISPKDIEKTALITRNGTFAFLRMPFDLSETAPNFQRAIDIILKPVIGRFVSVYMDDVIITSPSFNEHLDHLNQVFTLLRNAGLTLNKDKCHFARDKLKYLGLVSSKEGIESDHSKVKAITEIKPPKNSKEVSNFLGMAGWYRKFIPQGAEEQRNREYSTEQHQEKEPQYGSFRRRSSGMERIKGKEKYQVVSFHSFLLSNKWSEELLQ
ncbi:retrovirus-related Pol polyprotein from transposon 297 [Trichonephila clavipes]|uniref:Retrovirus-related Pol polyprotein from transposon 297 n=1 Tax=Trichonephila clavipes TaxID=2585209 RepID=A0A8X6VAL0_TRICX|nr:retrovirus-related Pol polyprotein from transposon 297 [Trichonephila clavipes]